MAIEFFRLNSLRSRLLWIVALAIAPSVLVTIYTGWNERQNAIAAAQENLQRLTRLAAVNEAQSINSARQLLMDLSDVPDLVAGARQCNALMRRVLSKNPGYVNLGLIQLNGDVTCSAVPSRSPVNLADREHFKRAVAERRFIAGNYVFGRVIEKHTINLTYPVIGEDGVVIGVVFAALDLFSLDRFATGLDLPAGAILITTDENGGIISRRPDPGKWFGREVSPEMRSHILQKDPPPAVLTGPDGIPRLHTFAHVGTAETSNYTLTIGIPRHDIVAAAQHDQNISLATLAVTTALALFATWLVGNVTIVRRVKALVQTAQRITAGDLKARSGIKYGREEISLLARALDEMASALERKDTDRDMAEQKLRAADQRKDQFLAMLAHELRNPLAPISAAAQIIRLTDTSGGDARQRQASEIIIRQVTHMASLIDDLIDVARVTRGLVTTDKKPQDIKLIVADAVEQVRPLIKTRRHHLIVDADGQNAFVLGDHKRLVQIVANVLHNAAKYTPEGGSITLQLKAEGDQITITVSDDGIGISADLLPYVFDLFTQAERTADRSQGGLGIGLALVKSIVELHGGSVSAHSNGPGTGSKFVIRLPMLTHQVQAPRLPERPAVALPAGSQALRVLIVDDNVDAARILAMFLEADGHQVMVEHTSRRALERARLEVPDVCLLDIGLPDFDGYELARRLRKQPETAGALLIAVTGYDRKQDLSARAAVFDHYFVKPIDTARLTELLAGFASPEKRAANMDS
jgi:signal transduction histidine kinase/ActR/RegA family two-component response regulator